MPLRHGAAAVLLILACITSSTLIGAETEPAKASDPTSSTAVKLAALINEGNDQFALHHYAAAMRVFQAAAAMSPGSVDIACRISESALLARDATAGLDGINSACSANPQAAKAIELEILHEKLDEMAAGIDAATVLKTVNTLLLNAANTSDPDQQASCLRNAREMLEPLLKERDEDPEIWRAAGSLALATSDDNLAALALDNIIRLIRNPSREKKWAALYARLNNGSIAEKAQVLHDEHCWSLLLLNTAQHGSVSAMDNVGMRYVEGKGFYRDEAEGVKWFQRGAERDSISAMYHLGECYRDGRGVGRSPEIAFDWFSSASDRGSFEARFALAKCHAVGEGTARDPVKALVCAFTAAMGGNSDAVKWFDSLESRKLAREAADLLESVTGNPVQRNLRSWYSVGVVAEALGDQDLVDFSYEALIRLPDLEKDRQVRDLLVVLKSHVRQEKVALIPLQREKVLRNWHRVAIAGDFTAMLAIGDAYVLGQGVPKSDERATAWYLKCEESATPDLLVALSDRFSNGAYIRQRDEQRAFQLVLKAASQGNSEGAYRAGDRLLEGNGIEPNHEAGLRWLAISAARANIAARSELTRLADVGDIEAILWLSKARELIDQSALNASRNGNRTSGNDFDEFDKR